MEQFIYREDYKFLFNNFIKCFVRPKKIISYGVHRPSQKIIGKYCDSYFNYVYLKRNKEKYHNPKLSDDTSIVLIHYMTLDFKSLEEKRQKQIKSKQPCYYDKNKYTKKWYNQLFKDNILDKRMYKYIEKIKSII